MTSLNEDTVLKTAPTTMIPITEFKLNNASLSVGNNLSQSVHQNVFQFPNERILYNFPTSTPTGGSIAPPTSANPANSYSQLFQYQTHLNQYASKHDLIELASNNYNPGNNYGDMIGAKKLKSENSGNEKENNDEYALSNNNLILQQQQQHLHHHQQQQQQHQTMENIENISDEEDLDESNEDEDDTSNNIEGGEENNPEKSNIDMDDLDNISNVNDPSLAINGLEHGNGQTLSTSSSSGSTGSSGSPPLSLHHESASSAAVASRQSSIASFPNLNQYLSSCFNTHYGSGHNGVALNYSNSHLFNNASLNSLNSSAMNEGKHLLLNEEFFFYFTALS